MSQSTISRLFECKIVATIPLNNFRHTHHLLDNFIKEECSDLRVQHGSELERHLQWKKRTSHTGTQGADAKTFVQDYNIAEIQEATKPKTKQLTEKSSVQVSSWSAYPGPNLQMVNMWLNMIPSVHSDCKVVKSQSSNCGKLTALSTPGKNNHPADVRIKSAS